MGTEGLMHIKEGLEAHHTKIHMNVVIVEGPVPVEGVMIGI